MRIGNHQAFQREGYFRPLLGGTFEGGGKDMKVDMRKERVTNELLAQPLLPPSIPSSILPSLLRLSATPPLSLLSSGKLQ